MAFLCAVSLLAAPRIAIAAGGSGTASVVPPNTVVAGAFSSWTITYLATENFEHPGGGVVEIWIPAGWTAPQVTNPLARGYVGTSNTQYVDSIITVGQRIRLRLGTPSNPFTNGTPVSVHYGVGGPAQFARADTVAPKTATFLVLSQPRAVDTLLPIAASPSLQVVPDVVDRVQIVNDTLGVVLGMGLTTDMDSTRFHLRGYDRFGNSARFVNGAWSVTGGIGFLTDPTTTGRRLVATTVGGGKVYADSGAWKDSTNLINVVHGNYAALAMTASAAATAGVPFAASAEARDADANRTTTFPGAVRPLRIVAYADSLTSTMADPSFVSSSATTSAGIWNGALTPQRAGTFFLAARDTLTGFESSPRRKVVVAPGSPDHLEIQPDTLRLIAGAADTVTVIARDVFGNRAPFAANEELTLWTDRPQGRFESLGGTEIFAATIPSGSDSAAFRFRDTEATVAPGRIRAIDANGAAPFVGTAAAPVITSPSVPSGSVALTILPDTLVADAVDLASVASGVVRDAYGNPVSAGERFTVTGAGVTIVTDDDPLAAGAQWTASGSGTIAGSVRAATTAGPGSVSVASERGSASGSAPLFLIAGPPAGVVVVAASPDSVAADGLATRTITAGGLRDAFSNPVLDGERYTVATSLGSITNTDADPSTAGIQVSSSGGAIAFDVLGGDVLGTATVSVSSVRGSSAGSTSLRMVPGAVSAESSLAVATTPVSVGAPGSTVTVTLRDRKGHAIPDVSSASIVIGVSGVAVTMTPLASGTDALGVLRYAAASTATGTSNLTVTARGVTLAAAPSIVFTHGPLAALVVSGPAGPLGAGASQDVIVEARDAFGNAMPDRSDVIRPSVTGGAATGLPASTTLSGGAATLSFTPTLAAPLTISVADDSSHAATYGPVSVVAGAPHRIVVDPLAADTLEAGRSIAAHARVFDAQGNAAGGDTVVASVVAGGGSVQPSAGVTDASGAVDFLIGAGSTPGAVTIRFAAAGSAAPDSVRADSLTLTVVPSSAASAVIAALADTLRAGDTLDMTITLRDAFGNVAERATPTLQLDTSSSLPDSVSWSAGPGASGLLVDGGTSSDQAAYTFAPADSGRATLRVRLTRSETVRMSAAGVGPAALSGDVTVVPAAAAALAVVSGQGQTAVVGRELALPLRVSVRDRFQNLVPGASVEFRVQQGGGVVDAVRGLPLDGAVAAGGSGIASCEVVQLGTVAGASSQRFTAALPSAGDSVVFAATALPDTLFSIALAPTSLGLGPSATATVTATARDVYANPVPGAPLTIYLGSTPSGSLESMGQTGGSGTTQAGSTDAAGQVAVRYRAAATAPAADTVFARGTGVGPVSASVVVTPSGAASLVVLPAATTWTAGAPVSVTVRALDPSGNIATGDTATIVLGATGAASFSPPFGSLSGGEFTTLATSTVAGGLQISARAASGSSTFLSPAITVNAAAPAGSIPVVAGRVELTADGRSTTTATFGPVQDAYGNGTPPGTLLTIDADSLVAPDASPAAGLQVATGADNLARAIVVAPASAGLDTILARSAVGTAVGSLEVRYIPPPSLARSSPVAPAVVAPGQAVSFTFDVANTAAAGTVTIGTASVFSFGTGAATFQASPAAPLTIAAGSSATLSMASATVPAGVVPGVVAPSLRLIGTDATGDPFDFYLPLGGSQVSVAGVRVVAVSATPNPVPLGHPSLALAFRIDNLAAVPATIDAATLTPAMLPVNGTTPALPTTLPALGSTTVTLSVSVPASGITPGTILAANLTASVSYGGATVNGATASPLSFQVISAASLVAQAAGTGPARYLRARTFAPAARVANGGSAPVTLAQGATRLVLERGATRLESGLSANAAVSGGASADLAFDSLAVPPATPLGRYAAWLVLAGTESGQAFIDTIALAPDSVDVLEPAILAVTGTIAPDTVSSGQTRPLQVTVANSGDVPFVMDGTSRLLLGAPVSAALIPVSPGLVPAHGSSVVAFVAATLGSPSASGTATAVFEARGSEDGRAAVVALPAGSLLAMPPSSITYAAGSTTPNTVRAGQTVTFTASIANAAGRSPFVVDPARTRFSISDGVESATAVATGAPFLLAPGATAAMIFPGVALPSALASQPYPVALVVGGTEWGVAESTSVVSGAGEVQVVEQAAAVQLRALASSTPAQAAPEGGPFRLWRLEVQSLIPPGGSASAHVQSIALTVLVDGVPASIPSVALADMAIRDARGVLLAQATPASANPVVLVLSPALALVTAAESLDVEIALQPGTAARSVALRVAAAADLVATDDLTLGPVPVTAPGGLPFQPITSAPVTLFAAAHGYPNPFRAGREDVRLSYRLGADAAVRVGIYTLLGDLVREIALPAGAPGGARGLNEVPWDGKNGHGETVRPGVYVARIDGGGVSETIKVGVLR